MFLQQELALPQFPRSAKYDIEWVNENEMGPNSMWLAEFLSQDMNFKNGMRVLDLGCGKAMSSIFLAKEFGVEVWAVDWWIKAEENMKRIKEMNLENLIHPVHAEAHNLPFEKNFFDAIVSLDAYHYFGTDEMYFEYITTFLKSGGQIGITVVGVKNEFNGIIPEVLKQYWEPYLFTHHTAAWWKSLWEHWEIADVIIADTMPNGYENWLKWDKTLKDAGVLKRNGDVEMLETDGGNFTFPRVIATKR